MKIVMKLVFFVIISAIVAPNSDASTISVGKGKYTTDLPAGQKGPSDKDKNSVQPSISKNFSKPVVTHAWWSSLLWHHDPKNQWSQNLFAHPMVFRAYENGLGIGAGSTYKLSNESFHEKGNHKTREYHYVDTQDLRVGIANFVSPQTVADDYSDFAVTALWNTKDQSLLATMAQGVPFVYFIKKSTENLTISMRGAEKVWYNKDGVLGVTINNNHYGIFAPSGSVWTKSDSWQSSLNGKEYCSVSLLPDNTPQTLEFYRKHAYAFIVDTNVSWQYNQPKAEVVTTFQFKTALKETGKDLVNRPLVALYRHQWLHTDHAFTNYSYTSARGVMKVIDDSSFTTRMIFNGVLPALPYVALDGKEGFSQAQLAEYVNEIYQQDKKKRWNNFPKDTYWNGKVMQRLALLVEIADQVKNYEARDLFLQELKENFEQWFNGTAKTWYYDKQWRALIGYPSSYGSDVELNDHHFHYGYFVLTAATIARYDAAWADQSQWGGMINLLIKDCANWDKKDTQFGFLKHFDPYAGHSWANGPSLFGSGENQESSSESINFSAGVILWGAATGNNVIRDLGIYLYTTEAEAIKQYWFDVDGSVFPKDFTLDLQSEALKIPAVGMVWGNGGAYAIWWSGSAQEIHGINFTPITTGSFHLGHYPEYLKKNHAFMAKNGADASVWRDIHLGVRAFYDPQGAIKEFEDNKNYKPEAGHTKAYIYNWIHMINALGAFDLKITANIPTYSVFVKGKNRMYVAYNPSKQETTVQFSDGFKLKVPANSMATSSGALISYGQPQKK